MLKQALIISLCFSILTACVAERAGVNAERFSDSTPTADEKCDDGPPSPEDEQLAELIMSALQSHEVPPPEPTSTDAGYVAMLLPTCTAPVPGGACEAEVVRWCNAYNEMWDLLLEALGHEVIEAAIEGSQIKLLQKALKCLNPILKAWLIAKLLAGEYEKLASIKKADECCSGPPPVNSAACTYFNTF